MASIKIQVLNVTTEQKPTAKGSYGIADIAYKNLTFQGKVEGKKIMSFGATAEAYKTLSNALSGQIFDIEYVKNDKGYNDWVKAVVATADSTASPASSASASTGSIPAPRSNYETPEERAQRQVFIIRQSSISSAISTLVAGAKSAPKSEDVLALAKEYENYVMGKDSDKAKISESFFADGGDDLSDVPM